MLNEMKSRILSGKTRIILLFVITFCCSYLSATIINIPADQPTIQAGINIAVDGDTVLVQPGTYVGNINFNGKNITVGSLFLTTQDTSYISQTIIDGNGNRSVVKFENEEDTTAVLSGFTIKNGYASNGNGGGIYCVNSSPSLENVTITENIAYDDGGGIYCDESSPSLENVTITGNTANDRGGGIYCVWGSNPSLENVTITGNIADYGGGIYCVWYSNPSLENVTITGNSASDGNGGGIRCYYSSPSLENVTIIGNSASDYGGGIYCRSSSPILENVTIIGNSAGSSGGGICCYESSLSLVNVIITGNSADYGGGIYCFSSSSPNLENVTITENSASSHGGGICFWTSNPSLENVTITGNTANDRGGGIYCLWYSNPSLENVTITGNIAGDGGGIYCCYNSSPSLVNTIVANNTANYGICVYSGNPTITYSDFYNNENGNFYNCNDSIGVNVTTNTNGDSCDVYYNIQLDPLFLDPDNGDYHLTSNSPCIDAGDPDSPLDPDGTIADMGAFYYDQGDIILIWPGDTDYSGIVNEEDILPIGVYWRDTGFPRSTISFEWVVNYYPGGWEEPIASLADCNGDGEVNITDVLAICLNWHYTHETVIEEPLIPDNIEDYIDNFVEIYNTLGNSEIEIKIRNHIAEKFGLPIIEIVNVNKLSQNYPNPFNPETKISFSIKQNSKIELEIFNVKGQKVKTLINEFRQSGNHSIFWNGYDAYGNKVSSGLYFYKLNINGRTEDVKKCLLVK